MSGPQFIICERRGAWAAVLARYVPPQARVRQTRSLAECATALSAAPASLVALEVSAGNLSGALAWLARLPRRFPSARAVVLADRQVQCYEWLLREAGAAHFTSSPRELEGIGPLLQNHFARVGVSKVGFAEQVWDLLPWSEAATA